MNPYAVLGVTEKTPLTEIKAAYVRAAMKWHPDKNSSKNAAAKMKEINVAWDAIRYGKQNEAYTNTITKKPPQTIRTYSVTLEQVSNGVYIAIDSDHRVFFCGMMDEKTGAQYLHKKTNTIIRFQVEPHPRFTRNGDDLYCIVEVEKRFIKAGNTFPFRYLNNNLTNVRIPKGFDVDCHRIILRGKGLPNDDDYSRLGNIHIRIIPIKNTNGIFQKIADWFGGK